MSERTQLVEMARDVYKNRFSHSKYTKEDACEALRNKLVDLNGGSTILDYKAFRRNKTDMFEIIEDILTVTVLEGLPDDNFFRQFVEFKNLKLGDQNSFYVPDRTKLVVSEIADGTTALRRQRLDVGTNESIPTTIKGIKIYEHLSRLLSGRVDFTKWLDEIEKAFRLKINDDIYTAFTNSFNDSALSSFVVSGSFDEDNMIDLVEHVEAASGRQAIIVGTMKALRKITTAIVSDSAKEDVYKMGHYGSFNGTPMMRIRQVHTVGSYSFKLSSSNVYVVTTAERPVKFVTEGEALIVSGDALGNSDLTQEYFIANKYGVGVVITDLYGMYSISD